MMLKALISWFRPEKIINEFLKCSRVFSVSKDVLNEFRR